MYIQVLSPRSTTTRRSQQYVRSCSQTAATQDVPSFLPDQSGHDQSGLSEHLRGPALSWTRAGTPPPQNTSHPRLSYKKATAAARAAPTAPAAPATTVPAAAFAVEGDAAAGAVLLGWAGLPPLAEGPLAAADLEGQLTTLGT